MNPGGHADHFAQLMEPVARFLFGDPNKAMSSKAELRFGNRGSLSVDLQKGVFYWHGEGKQGGVLDLIEAEKGLKGREAVQWLRDNGFDLPDNREQRPGGPKNRPEGASPNQQENRAKIVASYPYVDEKGALLFEVVRMEPKDFRQRRKARPDDPPQHVRNGWVWSVKGCRQVPYRLPELLEAMKDGQTIFVCEGEKDADNLWKLGVPATTNAQGAGKWPPELNSFFTDADVVVLPDNDPQARDRDGNLRFKPDGRPIFVGQDHAELVAGQIGSVARNVRVLELPDLPLKGDVSDWIEAGGTADQLYDLLETRALDGVDWVMSRPGPSAAASSPPWDELGRDHAQEEPNRPFVSRFNARPWAQLDAAGEDHEWLIKSVMTRREVAMMAGPSGCGKSFLGLDMAMAICRGERWFGNWVRQGGVIYQAGEGKRGLFKRLKAYRQEKSLSLQDPLDFVLMPAGLNLYANDDHASAFIAECRFWMRTFSAPLELVVIDTFGAATSGADENASRDMGPVLDRCGRISEELSASVLLVHHMNAGGTKARGWTGIQANIDSVLSVARLESKEAQPIIDNDRRQIREFVTIKQKDGEDGKRWRFVLPSIEIGRDSDGDPITSCVVRSPNDDGAPGAVETPKDAGMRLSAQGELFLRALRKALDDFGEEAPGMLRLPAGHRVVKWRHVLQTFGAMGFEGEGEADPKKRQDRVSQAAKRQGEALMQRRIIMRETPFVWLTGRKVRGIDTKTGAERYERTEDERVDLLEVPPDLEGISP